MLKLIGCHNACTGEEGNGFLSWLVTPFARTQSKTLREQYEAGCRLFDIRVKLVNGVWRMAHGLWTSKRDAFDILNEMDSWLERVIVTLTYEGGVEHNEDAKEFAEICKAEFKNLLYGPVCVKYGKDANGVKVKYDTLIPSDVNFFTRQGFIPLDGRSWHTYLPIPWLWDRLYKRPHEFKNDVYTYVDFL